MRGKVEYHVHNLEGKRGELELDVPLNWEPMEFMECID